MRGEQHPESGFTLVELVVVLLLISILGAVGMPRFFDRTAFDQWGYSDELSAALRYAQKVAIASGCHTQIDLTGGNYTLNQWSEADCRVPSSNPGDGFTRSVLLPGGNGATYSGSAPGGVSITVAVTVTPADTSPSIYFDGWGRPRKNGNPVEVFSITSGPRRIVVEPETGFIHCVQTSSPNTRCN